MGEGTSHPFSVLIDRGSVPTIADGRMIGYPLRIPLTHIGRSVLRLLAPLPFLEQVDIVGGRGIHIFHLAHGAVFVAGLLPADIFSRHISVPVIFVLVVVGCFPVLVLLPHQIAIIVGVADVLEGNRSGEGDGRIIFFVMGLIVGIFVVVAVPDGADKFPLDGRTAVRPVRNIHHGLLQVPLNDVEGIATNEHIDLPLGEFGSPAEKSGNHVLIGHPGVLKILGRDKVIADHVKLQTESRSNLPCIKGYIEFADRGIDSRVEQSVLAVHPLDGLNQIPLTGFLHEKMEVIIENLSLHFIVNIHGLDCLQLEGIGERKFPKHHREGADAVVAEVLSYGSGGCGFEPLYLGSHRLAPIHILQYPRVADGRVCLDNFPLDHRSHQVSRGRFAVAHDHVCIGKDGCSDAGDAEGIERNPLGLFDFAPSCTTHHAVIRARDSLRIGFGNSPLTAENSLGICRDHIWHDHLPEHIRISHGDKFGINLPPCICRHRIGGLYPSMGIGGCFVGLRHFSDGISPYGHLPLRRWNDSCCDLRTEGDCPHR